MMLLFDVIHIVTPYLALAYLNGDSAKAAKIYVCAAFGVVVIVLNLNPFETKSIPLIVASAAAVFGTRFVDATLNVFLLLS